MVQTVMEKRGQEHLDRRADTEGLGVVKQGKKLEKSQFIDDEAEEDDGSGSSEEEVDEEDDEEEGNDDDEPTVVKDVGKKKKYATSPKKKKHTSPPPSEAGDTPPTSPKKSQKKSSKKRSRKFVSESEDNDDDDVEQRQQKRSKGEKSKNLHIISEDEEDHTLKASDDSSITPDVAPIAAPSSALNQSWANSSFNPSNQKVDYQKAMQPQNQSTPRKCLPVARGGACAAVATDQTDGGVDAQRQRSNSTNSADNEYKVKMSYEGSSRLQPHICVYYQPNYSKTDLNISEEDYVSHYDTVLKSPDHSSQSSTDYSPGSPSYSFLDSQSAPTIEKNPVLLSPLSNTSFHSDYFAQSPQSISPNPSPLQISQSTADLLNGTISPCSSSHSKSLLQASPLSGYSSMASDDNRATRNLLKGLTDYPHCCTCKCMYL